MSTICNLPTASPLPFSLVKTRRLLSFEPLPRPIQSPPKGVKPIATPLVCRNDQVPIKQAIEISGWRSNRGVNAIDDDLLWINNNIITRKKVRVQGAERVVLCNCRIVYFVLFCI